MTERGHTPPTFPPGDTEPTSGRDAPSRLPSSSVSGKGWDSEGLLVGGVEKHLKHRLGRGVARHAAARKDAISRLTNPYRPDRQTRKVVRRLEKQGHHMVADVVRSYREHPAKGKRNRRIRWDNISMYLVAILLPVLLVGGEWWRKYLWVGLCVTVIVSLVSKPRKRHD